MSILPPETSATSPRHPALRLGCLSQNSGGGDPRRLEEGGRRRGRKRRQHRWFRESTQISRNSRGRWPQPNKKHYAKAVVVGDVPVVMCTKKLYEDSLNTWPLPLSMQTRSCSGFRSTISSTPEHFSPFDMDKQSS